MDTTRPGLQWSRVLGPVDISIFTDTEKPPSHGAGRAADLLPNVLGAFEAFEHRAGQPRPSRSW